MQMMKLLPPGYDLSKVSPEVTKAVMRGEMPDISLLPLDLQNYIRENMDTMFRSFSNTVSLFELFYLFLLAKHLCRRDIEEVA